jgi:transposase
MKKYIASLNDAEREECDNLVRKGTGKAKSITHARILLMADDRDGKGKPDEEIATFFGVNVRTVERLRQCLVEEGFEIAVYGRPYTTKVSKIKVDGDVQAHVIALSRSEAPKGRARWTMKLLASEMVRLQFVESISHESVRQVLKKMNSRPGGTKDG